MLPPVAPAEITAELRDERLLKLRELIERIPVAMISTAAADGSIHSRPMAYLHMEADGELVFFTRAASSKAVEVRRNRHVNLTFSDAGRNLYVSVSGRAFVLNDRAKIAALFTPILKQWFPAGADDPALRVFVVDPDFAEYWDGPSGLTLLLAMTKTLFTGSEAKELGEHDFFEF
ncbi:MAG TPA: pyridoxamine 5'-phosphate oxidase family protein [Bryobacteraceae bacterium]|jgi:general stress protein 26